MDDFLSYFSNDLVSDRSKIELTFHQLIQTRLKFGFRGFR
jgi:hypothetical protein